MIIDLSDCQLVSPTLALHEAFEAFVDDFLLHDGPNSAEYTPAIENFSEYIRVLKRQSLPAKLGYVIIFGFIIAPIGVFMGRFGFVIPLKIIFCGLRQEILATILPLAIGIGDWVS